MAYSAKQLVALACQIAKLNTGMAPQVGQFLNMILEEYAQTLDLDTLRKTVSFNVTAAATGVGITRAGYLLPSDYLREVQVFYNVNGTIFNLDPLPIETYYTLFQGLGIANYPESYATDISDQAVATNGAPVLFFWPPPAIPLTINLLYRPKAGAINAPETSSQIPFFPNQRILLRDICVDAMLLSDDSRKDGLEAEVERRMRKFLIMKDDKEGTPITVKLDPQKFRSQNALPPTKITSIF
jgi:hypothetical protein